MKMADWLDQMDAENRDLAKIEVPTDVSFDDEPDEILYFEEINPCGIFCTENHPFATVERFGHWYYSRGQDKKAGIHSSGEKWKLFTQNKALAVKKAKGHIK